jgi:hypothetical protein
MCRVERVRGMRHRARRAEHPCAARDVLKEPRVSQGGKPVTLGSAMEIRDATVATFESVPANARAIEVAVERLNARLLESADLERFPRIEARISDVEGEAKPHEVGEKPIDRRLAESIARRFAGTGFEVRIEPLFVTTMTAYAGLQQHTTEFFRVTVREPDPDSLAALSAMTPPSVTQTRRSRDVLALPSTDRLDVRLGVASLRRKIETSAEKGLVHERLTELQGRTLNRNVAESIAREYADVGWQAWIEFTEPAPTGPRIEGPWTVFVAEPGYEDRSPAKIRLAVGRQ